MGTLYIDRKDITIRRDGQALAFYSNGQREGIVPIKPLKRVVIIGDISIDTPALHCLAEEGVSVLFLSGKRLRFRGIFHGRLHNNGLLRVRQYQKSLSPFAWNFSLRLIKKKLTLQKSLLEDCMTKRPDLGRVLFKAIDSVTGTLDKLSSVPLSDMATLRGLEGGAATVYFSAYTNLFADSLEFNGREKRPPTDPVNALLSLTYTLLHFEIVREIEIIGLDPVIGFYHQFEYGRESLACDIIEPYRPVIDNLVWGLFRNRVFTVRDFTSGEERPGVYLKKSGRNRYYALYEEWVEDIRRQIREEVQNLAREILSDGQESLPE